MKKKNGNVNISNQWYKPKGRMTISKHNCNYELIPKRQINNQVT